MIVNENDRKRVRIQPAESSSHCRLYKTNTSMKQEWSQGSHELTKGKGKMSRREIPLELLGLAGLDPFYGTTHAARGAMFASQIAQAPVVNGSEPPRVLTGMELRLAEHSFNIKFPKDCTILGVFRKFTPGYGEDSIKHNPVTTVIYEEYYDVKKTIGVIHIPEYLQYHQDFGYPLEKNENVFSNLSVGQNFEANTPIAYSKSSGVKSGVHGIGVNANVIFKSSPGTTEDGFIFSKEFLEEKMCPNTYTTVVGNSGMRRFFLNLYGDDKRYQPFPDIGQRIRDDGVVFATRNLDDDLSPAEMTPRALREFDATFDTGVIGDPGGIVRDIDIVWNERQNPSFTPMGMETQLVKYYEATKQYYQGILDLYRRFQGRRRDKLEITPEFNQLIVEALTFLPQKADLRALTRTYRLDRLDEWYVKLTYESKRVPSNAWKLTCNYGGKGIACMIKPRAEMPVDKHGNIADCIIHGGSTFKRANFGRWYEHYWNATTRDLMHRLRVEFGWDRLSTPTDEQLNSLTGEQESYVFGEVSDLLMIMAPTQHEIITRHPDKPKYIKDCLKKGYIDIYTPATDDVIPIEVVDQILKSRFAPLRDTVDFVGFDGQPKTSKDPMIIAPLHLMLLEKLGDDWSAVASVKTQQFGLPARLNAVDKFSTPGREAAVRSFGESETRSFNCTIGSMTTNEMMDQTNNPDAHMFGIETILTAEKPSNIDNFVDRVKIPYGNSRSVGVLNHLLECRGIKFKHNEPTTEDHFDI